MSNETTKIEAETIFNQLGGTRRLAMMTGATNFSYGSTDKNETYVQFRVGRNAKKINLVKITLNGSDTYTTEFMWATTKAITVKSEFAGVYNDMLKEIFESSTGMYLTF
jgi:hypothetical protein